MDVGLVVGVVEEFDEGGEMGRVGEDGWGEDLGLGFRGWRRRGHGAEGRWVGVVSGGLLRFLITSWMSCCAT